MSGSGAIDAPRIVQSEAQELAVIHLEIPRSEIQQVMDPAIREVMSVVTSQGIGPTGPLCAYHVGLSKERFDFDVGFPVSAPVRPTGRVRPGRIPSVRVARTIYRGPYEGIFQAWRDFNTWVDTHRHKGASQLWERYLVGPESGPEASRWQTELNRPLLD